MLSIGDRIRIRREQLNISQDELAKALGYKTRSSITKIERDASKLPQDKIYTIALALDTTPAYIMGWEEEKPTGETADEPFANLSEEVRKFLVVFEKLNPDQKEQLYRLALTIVGEEPQPL